VSAVSRQEVRQRVAAQLAMLETSSGQWEESGVPYDRLLAHGSANDIVNRFAVKVGTSTPQPGRQKRKVGTPVKTPVFVRFCVELRPPPDQVPDLDRAEAVGHELLVKAFEVNRSVGLSLALESGPDELVLEPAEGRWCTGGFKLVAYHRLALSTENLSDPPADPEE
jgi:hypothetical protein